MPATVRERSLRDVVRSNTLLGGARALVVALRRVLPAAGRARSRCSTSARGSPIFRAAPFARPSGRASRLTTIGYDAAESLLRADRARLSYAVCGDALALPFGTRQC